MTTIINGSSPSITFSDSTTQTSAGLVVGTASAITAGTAVASTSGTSIDFTSIPSWVKRITVIFNEVSTNGSSAKLIQIGSGSVTSTGYVSTSIDIANSSATGGSSSTAGFLIYSNNAADLVSGHIVLTLISGNLWISSHKLKQSATQIIGGAGSVSLSGALDRLRVTTINGTDTFDAGSINILYE